MAQLTTEQYDLLERAIVDRRRIAVYRRGAEYVVVPERLRSERGREILEATRPSSRDVMIFPLDELDDVQVIR